MFFIEAIATFTHVSTVLGVIYSNQPCKMSAGIMIALGLFCVITFSAPMSGGCINPAVGVVQQLFQHLMVNNYPNTFNN